MARLTFEIVTVESVSASPPPRAGGVTSLSLPEQAAPRFTLLVRARDCGDPPLLSTATVHVSVREGNNHRPTFTQKDVRHLLGDSLYAPHVLLIPQNSRDEIQEVAAGL